MVKQPTISDAEWIVMQALWDDAPLTANQVVERVAGKNQWNPRTVKTLLNRLVKKKALRFEAEGNRYRYWPSVKRADCVRSESYSFLSRVFGGAVGPMLTHFVSESHLSEQEIAELKKLLERGPRKGKQP